MDPSSSTTSKSTRASLTSDSSLFSHQSTHTIDRREGSADAEWHGQVDHDLPLSSGSDTVSAPISRLAQIKEHLPFSPSSQARYSSLGSDLGSFTVRPTATSARTLQFLDAHDHPRGTVSRRTNNHSETGVDYENDLAAEAHSDVLRDLDHVRSYQQQVGRYYTAAAQHAMDRSVLPEQFGDESMDRRTKYAESTEVDDSVAYAHTLDQSAFLTNSFSVDANEQMRLLRVERHLERLAHATQVLSLQLQQDDRQAQHFERRRAEIEADLAELEAKIDAAQLKTDLLDETISQRLDQMEDAQQHIEEHLEHIEAQQERERRLAISGAGGAKGLLRYLVPLGSLVAGMLWQQSFPALPPAPAPAP
mmetsp:Transcript_29096/g.73142  ORF Transcript_29096/g.73142 Transcript_29096/m.73142 type:complete len:363 (+) Transcript_29096:197-1285(+)